MNFRSIAQKATTISPLMADATKLTTADVINSSEKNGLTINAVDTVDAKGEHYAVVAFEEINNAFYAGGTVLTGIVDAWIEEAGSAEEANEELAKENGVKVRFSEKLGKNGRTYTAIDVL